MTGNKPIGYSLSGISANTDYSVDALVDQRKKIDCIGLTPGKLMTGNNCMCEHSLCVTLMDTHLLTQKKSKKKKNQNQKSNKTK